MTLLHAPVAVWLDPAGRPLRLVWGGERYTVTDSPTPLDVLLEECVTHPPAGALVGWRFQGTSESGESRVFDVRYDRREAHWMLIGTYE